MADRLKIPSGLQTRGMFEPSTFNEERGTVEVTFTTGSRGLRGGLFSPPFYEELEVSERAVDLSRLNNGAPYMDDHPYKRGVGGVRTVLGVVERAWIAGKEGRALLRFSDREDVKPIKRDVQTGILRHVSIGYEVGKYDKVGEQDGIPVLRAVRWSPAEISQTPLAFDDRAVVRDQGDPKFYEVEVHSATAVIQETRSMANETTISAATTTAAAVATSTEQPSAVDQLVTAAREQRSAQVQADAAGAARAADAAAVKERERIAAIYAVVRAHQARTHFGDDFADKLVRSGAPIEKVNEIVLRELTKADEGTAIDGHLRFGAGDDVRDKFIRGAAASLYERTGHSQTIEEAKTNKRVGHLLRDVSIDPGEFRGMRVIDLARHSLELRGVSTKGLHGERLVRAALEYRGDSGFNASGDFTVLLETAVNKVYLGRYATIPVTWPTWCTRKSVQDFRTATFYRPGAFSVLDSVSEQGEVKHKNIPDGAKATLTPATKGNIIGVSRKMLVNDDLGFLRENASELGAATARTIEADAWALITAASGLGVNAPDGVALFNAGHANIGTTGAMSVATLDSIRVKMGLQKDPASNSFLALSPAILLVPLELLGTAKTFNASAADPTDYKNALVFNKVNGMFRDIVASPFLSASSATRVYGLADPNIGPVFAVGFIDGQEAPTLTSEQSFQYDGLQMRVLIDYGTAVIDFRGAATCAGA